MSRWLMALDQGTSSSRALIFDETGALRAQAAQGFDCRYPQPGWVEQSPLDLWRSQKQAMDEALHRAGIPISALAAIGITNQRETVIAWDRRSGEPLYEAIVWQCRRTAAECAALKAEGAEPLLRAKTGLVADPYFSGSKLAWLLKHVPAVARAAAEGRLAFGTVDSWLIWQLTGGRVHATDASNASRTLLFNIHERCWDEELLALFGVPAESLPAVHASSGVIARTDPALFGAEVPIAGVAGDQQAALFGQACFEPGMAKNTYGTGCFLLMNTGTRAVESRHGLLTTVAWELDGELTYALEGSVFIAGALVQWLRDALGLFRDAAETEALASSVPDTGGVHIVPAFVGLGAPYWDAQARGLICGLTRGSGRAQLVRAALEAVAYQSADLLQAMENDTGLALQELRIDGGMSVNGFLCQFQADVLGRTVSRPVVVECTALGAALLAGLGVGLWPDLAALRALWREARRFLPARPAQEAERLMAAWHGAVARARSA